MLAAACLWYGYRTLKGGEARHFGQGVERAALDGLDTHFPGWQLARNVDAGRIGDIDCIATSPDARMRAVIEVKSFGGIKIGIDGELVKANGKPTPKNIARQCLAQRDYVGASHAVLWLPLARRPAVFWHRGILVVNGDGQVLRSAMLNALG